MGIWSLMLLSKVDTEKTVLRDCIKTTAGFEKLGEAMKRLTSGRE